MKSAVALSLIALVVSVATFVTLAIQRPGATARPIEAVSPPTEEADWSARLETLVQANRRLEARIEELEGRADGGDSETDDRGGPQPVAPAQDGPEEEVETLARDLAESGSGEHDVDTPFAWTGEDEGRQGPDESREPGSGIGGYFDSLLSWGSDEE